jgi:solute carrier family 25 phosphate transporter 3
MASSAPFSIFAQTKAALQDGTPAPVFASDGEATYGPVHYLKGSFAGGLCCSITHGALCPVDVVKTRIQLDPVKYNGGMIGSARQIVAAEGAGALASGLGPTAVGYFVQGWFKFGGVEFFKINIAGSMSNQDAWNSRTGIYLLSAAMAEFIADIFLCPLEATRIRLVSDPTFGSGLMDAFPKIIAQDGVMKGFYSGFGPILLKQVPYTMAKFAVQGASAEAIYGAIGADPKKASDNLKLGVSLASGVVAGVAAAIISHPADTLLSLINKNETAGGTGSIMSRLKNLATEMGFAKLCLTGLGPRCVMIGTLTAGQFGIFDSIMDLTGAKKFHFHDPADDAH